MSSFYTQSTSSSWRASSGYSRSVSQSRSLSLSDYVTESDDVTGNGSDWRSGLDWLQVQVQQVLTRNYIDHLSNLVAEFYRDLRSSGEELKGSQESFHTLLRMNFMQTLMSEIGSFQEETSNEIYMMHFAESVLHSVETVRFETNLKT